MYGDCLTKITQTMRRINYLIATLLFVFAAAAPAWTQYNNGGPSAEKAEETVVDIAIESDDHETLVAAVKAAGLVETLQSEGPFTVFAPTDAAFAALPKGTVETLLKPENKQKLTSILTYHVIPGKFSSKAVVKAIKKGDGTAEIKTVNGSTIKAMMWDGAVYIKDANGNKAKVTAVDLMGSNGVVHVIDTVIMPE